VPASTDSALTGINRFAETHYTGKTGRRCGKKQLYQGQIVMNCDRLC
jgi:hypothetical protein